VTFDDGSGAQAGVLLDEEIIPASALGAPATSVRGLLGALDAEGLEALGERALGVTQRVPLAQATLGPPIPDPEKIICLGLNYSDHAAETGQDAPAAPLWFAKFANSLVGTGASVALPPSHPEHVDYEAELAVVIGRTALRVSSEEALDHVAGAMPFNDLSARDLQLQNPLWTSGKAIDGFAPCGPALVTLAEIPDIQDLALRTRVNGVLVQEGGTGSQIFSVATAVAWLSRTMTLLPGDIIATGTPAGVGAARGRFLRDGDAVEVEVEGLGAVVTHMTA
jgi:2-keto-4-pentenoate hydratase/2-oxohepta-3-ene-1,7-dioic acid hydratase in catechol pathway